MNTDNTIAKSAPRRRVAVSKKDFEVKSAVIAKEIAADAVPVAKIEAAAAVPPDRDRRDRRERRDNRAPTAPALSAKYAVFQDEQRHTCIRIGTDSHNVQFIPMAAILEVVELSHYDFEKQYVQALDYPVKQAARMYLEATHLERSPIAKKHLDFLCGNSFVDPVTVINFNEKESIMTPAAQKASAAKKTAAKAPPAAKPAKAPAPKAPAATRAAAPAAKTAPVKVAAPKETVKSTKTPAKVAPVVAQKVKVVAPGVKKESARASDTTEYRIADTDKVRKGATADACAVAKKLGASFTRPKLQAALEKAGWDPKVAKIKIADCIYFKVFAEAK